MNCLVCLVKPKYICLRCNTGKCPDHFDRPTKDRCSGQLDPQYVRKSNHTDQHYFSLQPPDYDY